MNPEMKKQYDERKKNERSTLNATEMSKPREKSFLSRTIDVHQDRDIPIQSKTRKPSNSSTYEEHLRQHPEFAMRNMRYASVNMSPPPKKSIKVNKNINSHFVYNMSTEDRKVISGMGK